MMEPAGTCSGRPVGTCADRDGRACAPVNKLEELERHYAVPTYARLPVHFVRGEGCRLWDEAGSEYIDFLAGISVLNVGHCHPRVVEAVREQTGRLP